MSESPAMQMRCVHCKAEQYAPAVFDISHGRHPCCWCGMRSKQMTQAEYRAALAQPIPAAVPDSPKGCE